MKASLLHVVAVISNPMRWQSRIRLYHEFEQHMLDSGVRLTTVECSYGDRPYETAGNPHVNHVPVRSRSVVWNKESLINAGLNRLLLDWKYAAWVDADIMFRKPGWAAETVHALQQYDVVQPWSHCYDLGPDDSHLQAHHSFCKLFKEGRPIRAAGHTNYEFAHPGYAWAATRAALEQLGGVMDIAALGAGDHHMALALIGRAAESMPANIHANYRRAVLGWQARATQHICENIGYVPGTIEHRWHGSKERRAYISRWDILLRHAFNPEEDLKRNTSGIMELAGNKPAFARDIDAYMRSRNEDANSL